jgi:hypothetical protein
VSEFLELTVEGFWGINRLYAGRQDKGRPAAFPKTSERIKFTTCFWEAEDRGVRLSLPAQKNTLTRA